MEEDPRQGKPTGNSNLDLATPSTSSRVGLDPGGSFLCNFEYDVCLFPAVTSKIIETRWAIVYDRDVQIDKTI